MTIIVDTINDAIDPNDGVTSLREAIEEANNTSGLDTIEFDETKLSGKEIALKSGELEITDDLTIDGLGADKLTVSGNKKSRVFKVDDGDSENRIDVVIDGLTIADGLTDGNGGGILTFENLTLTNSTISGNKAAIGGGIYAYRYSVVQVADSKISGNRADFGGGGIYSRYASVKVTNSTISENEAENEGGGISQSEHADLEVTNSTISGNTARGELGEVSGGGGIASAFSGGEVMVSNSTISGNVAESNGGGIFTTQKDTALTMTNSTIYRNTAQGRGGGIFNGKEAKKATVRNSIIAKNKGTESDVSGDFTGGEIEKGIITEFNLVGDGTGSTGGFINSENGNQVGTNEKLINPRLGSLQDNGGSTETQALLPGSRAIDSADPDDFPSTDQRGVTRPQGNGLDIGAVEAIFSLTVDTLVDENDGDLSPGDVSLREALRFISPGGTIDFDPNLASGDAGAGQGTIGLTLGELVIDKDLTINGLGANKLKVSGNNASRVFQVDDGDSSNQVDVVINGLTIADGLPNTPNRNGGGIRNFEDLTITNSTISSNTAGLFGGGIFNEDQGILTVTKSTISQNKADGSAGGGIFNLGTLTVTNSTISGNQAVNSGGGISNQGLTSPGIVTVTNSTIDRNISGFEGGGIDNFFSTLTVTNSTISRNRAKGGVSAGGGISGTGSNLRVSNSTISNNQTDGGGGGINSGGFNTLTVTNSTISRNTADKNGDGNSLGLSLEDGGGIRTLGSEVTIKNTIIAKNFDNTDNTSQGNIHPDVSGDFTTTEFNLIGDGTGSIGFTDGDNGNQVGTNEKPINPRLGSLQDNGGSTETHALLPSLSLPLFGLLRPASPAINAGDPNFVPPPNFDQRGSGFPRVLNGRIDIGAFESSFTPPPRIIQEGRQRSIGKLTGTSLADKLTGNSKANILTSGAGKDRLDGGGGRDSLSGGTDKDRLDGGRGDDLLDGGRGSDRLKGDRGADGFVLREGDGRDIILDYHDGQDRFLLADGLAFDELTITQGRGETSISVTDTNEELASLIGVQANLIGSEDFTTLV